MVRISSAVFLGAVVFLGAILLMSGCAQEKREASDARTGPNAAPISSAPNATLSFPASNISFAVEWASTPAEIERGLMFRPSLGGREGMLFDMGRMSKQPFWMYHTLIPLDAVFLDERMRVVDVAAMTPCASEDARQCQIYAPKNEMRYVLEVNGGAARKWGIKEGDAARVE